MMEAQIVNEWILIENGWKINYIDKEDKTNSFKVKYEKQNWNTYEIPLQKRCFIDFQKYQPNFDISFTVYKKQVVCNLKLLDEETNQSEEKKDSFGS